MRRTSENCKLIWQDIDLSTKSTFVYSTRNVSNWINIEAYHNVMAVIFRTVGTGNLKGARIRVATSVTGTGAATLVSLSGSTKATGLINVAAGSNDGTGIRGIGMAVLEATSSNIRDTVAEGNYVQVQVNATTATDEFGVLWILSDPRFGKADLTSTGNAGTAGYA